MSIGFTIQIIVYFWLLRNDLLKVELRNLTNLSHSSISNKIIDTDTKDYLRPYPTTLNDRPS